MRGAGLLAGICLVFGAWCAEPAPEAAVAASPAAELFAAAAQGRLSRLETLLAQGADANGKTPAGRTALMLAAANGNAGAVRALLVYGAEVDAADSRGVTALMDAVTFGRSEVVKLLLDAGAASSDPILQKAKKIGDKTIITLLEQTSGQKPEGGGKTAGEGAAKGNKTDGPDKSAGGKK